MSVALLIFDSDGVLVDSEPLSERVFGQALRALGLRLSPDEIAQHFQGRSMPDCVRVLREQFTVDVPPGFVERYEAELFDVFRRELRPVPGVREAIEALPYRRCVASSGSPEKVRTALGIVGLRELFEPHIFSGLQVPRSKPAPDLFLLAAERMGSSPEECVVVEDSVRGVQAARAAGMRVIGYAGRTPADALAAAGAEVIGTMGELVRRVGGGED
jgi:HAD superfamily hydrolase (TIGR01509 family)